MRKRLAERLKSSQLRSGLNIKIPEQELASAPPSPDNQAPQFVNPLSKEQKCASF
jgi:hypothetical protein